MSNNYSVLLFLLLGLMMISCDNKKHSRQAISTQEKSNDKIARITDYVKWRELQLAALDEIIRINKGYGNAIFAREEEADFTSVSWEVLLIEQDSELQDFWSGEKAIKEDLDGWMDIQRRALLLLIKQNFFTQAEISQVSSTAVVLNSRDLIKTQRNILVFLNNSITLPADFGEDNKLSPIERK